MSLVDEVAVVGVMSEDDLSVAMEMMVFEAALVMVHIVRLFTNEVTLALSSIVFPASVVLAVDRLEEHGSLAVSLVIPKLSNILRPKLIFKTTFSMHLMIQEVTGILILFQKSIFSISISFIERLGFIGEG